VAAKSCVGCSAFIEKNVSALPGAALTVTPVGVSEKQVTWSVSNKVSKKFLVVVIVVTMLIVVAVAVVVIVVLVMVPIMLLINLT
jgi:copper chaperone CopZ